MKNSSNSNALENKIFVRVVAVLAALLGLTLFIVTFKLRHTLSVGMISLALVYGVLLLSVAHYAWRIKSEVSAKISALSHWLISAGLIGAVSFALMTPPSVFDLPLIHPKPMACAAMLACAAMFAYKATARR